MSQPFLETEAAELSWPAPPAIVREPLAIGAAKMPSRFFLAPLAGYTGLPFRRTVRELGGLGLATTDLVNARALIERRPRSLELSATTPDDQPVAIQIYGNVAAELRQAARIAVDRGATIIDINMGCPVRQSRQDRRRFGADAATRFRRRIWSRRWSMRLTFRSR